MATFGLVHGAWHGGWAWELLVPELERRGHRAVAPELPCDDVEAGVSRYAQLVAEALGDADDVMLVGHSLAGITIPLVAALRPVSHLVYLCAFVPQPGRPFRERFPEGALVEGFGADAADDDGRTYWTDEEAFTRGISHDCPPALAHAAFLRHRPQPRALADLLEAVLA